MGGGLSGLPPGHPGEAGVPLGGAAARTAAIDARTSGESGFSAQPPPGSRSGRKGQQMKRFIFATHHSMASGMKDTMEFLTKSEDAMYDISAYMGESQDEDLEGRVAALMAGFDPADKVVIFTDLMSGSVNQKFFPYMNDHVFLLSGANVPLAMQVLLAEEDDITEDFIRECVTEAREQLIYINDWQKEQEAEDEDE